ncbi:MAG: cation transporter, partial [Verrucomicrobiota bacterium]
MAICPCRGVARSTYGCHPCICDYDAGEMTTALKVSGMSCQNCARHVREALAEVTGVASVEVKLDAGEARVRWNSEENVPTLLEALQTAGYPGVVIDAGKKSPVAAGSGWRLNVILGLACTIPLMAGEWFLHWNLHPWFGWLGFGLILPVQVIAGARFYRGAWQQLKIGHSNMDTLVSLGSTAAFGFSVYGLFGG